MLFHVFRRHVPCRGDLESRRAPAAFFVPVLVLAIGVAASAQDVRPVTITGTVFFDLNGNGAVDIGERSAAGVPVELRSGVLVDSALTADDGSFGFRRVDPDETYWLRPVGIDHLDVIPPDTRIVRPAARQRPGPILIPLLLPCEHGTEGSANHVAGVPDGFAPGNQEPAAPGPELQASRPNFAGLWEDFDFGTGVCDRCFGHTFEEIKPADCFVTAARLRLRLRANSCVLESNDSISLGTGGVVSWSRRIGDIVAGGWDGGDDETITLNLAALPGPGTSTTAMLGALASGSLDVFVQDDTAVDFVELQVRYCCPPDLSGHKYEDVNLNGVRDSGEPGVPGWVIDVQGPNGGSVQVLTDADGYWSYQAPSAGAYTVSEGSQAGWRQIAPVTGNYTVNWTAGQMHSGLDFGNFRDCDEADTVDFETLVAEGGVADGFDPAGAEPSSMSVDLEDRLTNCSGGLLASFDVLPCNRCFGHTFEVDVREECRVIGGRLTIRVRGGAGCLVWNDAIGLHKNGSVVWSLRFEDLSTSGFWGSGSDETFVLDLADLPPNSAGVTNILSLVQDGVLSVYVQDDSGVDFANLELDVCCDCLPGRICGVKFEDLNGNGVRDPGEPGLPGWEIQALGPMSSHFATTGVGGRYCLDNLPPGEYVVFEVPQPGWVQTYPQSVVHRVDICGRSDHQGPIRLDFGNILRCETPEITVCEAGHEDGFDTADGPETSTPSPALLALMQGMSNGAQTSFDIQTSNRAFGHTFEDCWQPGCLVVGARLEIGVRADGGLSQNDTISFRDGATSAWVYSVETLAGVANWASPTSAVISLDLANLPPDGNQVTDVLALLQDGDLDVLVQDDTSVDYLRLDVEYCCTGSISGQKFEDLDGDSVKDPGEPTLAGWDIELRDNLGALLANDITDASGSYEFPGLTSGVYLVSEVQQGGWVQTAPASVSHTVNLVGGSSYPNRDFGNHEIACEEQDREEARCRVGSRDNFDLADGLETTSPSAALLGLMATVSGGATTLLDVLPTDRAVGHTFDECWSDGCLVLAARLRLRLRGGPSTLSSNDSIWLLDGATRLWGVSISTLVGNVWGPNQTADISLDLQSLPPDTFGVTNILASLQDAELGILVQDDTGVDYMRLDVELCCPEDVPPLPEFVRGDTNVDGAVDLADARSLLKRLFLGGNPSRCRETADVNNDGEIDVRDGVGLLTYLFRGGSRPAQPSPPDCGPDPQAPFLGCDSYRHCP